MPDRTSDTPFISKKTILKHLEDLPDDTLISIGFLHKGAIYHYAPSTIAIEPPLNTTSTNNGKKAEFNGYKLIIAGKPEDFVKILMNSGILKFKKDEN